ncbi:hypothetical protein CLV49_1693 [Labedella gwakjiensis]|uniref:Uncharacterized protein n=1 Tax=Labedella gwakjiensis TaxID=390269 RepID=A0A2P8GVT2_9MICO|nr:hypothetical protein [Labedella gwakjiensis]PSL38081.1 hypothetical protein CLV49_1693 [Labedella gwakjiensis]
MTASIVQASCAVDVVVCDDTSVNDFGAFPAIVGLVVLLLAIAAVVHAVGARRRR